MLNKISNVEIKYFKEKGTLIGFANLVWDNLFELNCIGIHAKPNGTINLTFTKRTPSEYYFFPISEDAKKAIQTAIKNTLQSEGYFGR